MRSMVRTNRCRAVGVAQVAVLLSFRALVAKLSALPGDARGTPGARGFLFARRALPLALRRTPPGRPKAYNLAHPLPDTTIASRDAAFVLLNGSTTL